MPLPMIHLGRLGGHDLVLRAHPRALHQPHRRGGGAHDAPPRGAHVRGHGQRAAGAHRCHADDLQRAPGETYQKTEGKSSLGARFASKTIKNLARKPFRSSFWVWSGAVLSGRCMEMLRKFSGCRGFTIGFPFPRVSFLLYVHFQGEKHFSCILLQASES